jgi:hypothetical protein
MSLERRVYAEAVKRSVVDEIEKGVLSIREAVSETGAQVSQIKLWLEEYGKYQPKRDIVEVVMKSEREEIKELQKALAEAHLKLRLYDELFEIGKKRYKVDLKKSIGTRVSERSAVVVEEKVSVPRAKRLGIRETGTTSTKGGRERSGLKKKL